VLGPVIGGDELAWIRIVGVVNPAIVVTEVVAGVIRWVGQNQIHLPPVAVERGHHLEVVTLHDQVLGLLLGCPIRVLGKVSLDAGAQLTQDTSDAQLARELHGDAGLRGGGELHLDGGGDRDLAGLLRTVV
jgi:hypothetical protein